MLKVYWSSDNIFPEERFNHLEKLKLGLKYSQILESRNPDEKGKQMNQSPAIYGIVINLRVWIYRFTIN